MEYKLDEFVKAPGNVIGQVVARSLECRTVYSVRLPSGLTARLEGRDLEPAPRLTPEEAWAQLPILVLREIVEHERTTIPLVPEYNGYISSDKHSAIRHECYKLLGGSGVKITEEVKERVRNKITEIGQIVNVYVFG